MNEILPSKIRFLAAYCHLSGLAWIGDFYLVSANISHAQPNSDVFNYLLALSVFLFLLPLLIWSFIKKTHDFVDRSGRKALNYHLSILFYILCMLSVMAMTCGIMIPAVSSGLSGQPRHDPISNTAGFIFLILSAILSNIQYFIPIHAISIFVATFYTLRGEIFSYPLTIPFLKNV
jgi:uncharacterized Tic20 family protein